MDRTYLYILEKIVFQVLIGILTMSVSHIPCPHHVWFQVLIGILTIILFVAEPEEMVWVSSPYRYSNNPSENMIVNSNVMFQVLIGILTIIPYSEACSTWHMFQVLIGILTINASARSLASSSVFQVLIGILTMLWNLIMWESAIVVSSPYRYSNNSLYFFNHYFHLFSFKSL